MIRGQFNILDLNLDNTDYKIWAKVTGKSTNLEDYLKKEKRILSLKREIKSLTLADVPFLKLLAKKGVAESVDKIAPAVKAYIKSNFLQEKDEIFRYISPAFDRSKEDIPLDNMLICQRLKSIPKRYLSLGFDTVTDCSKSDSLRIVLADNCGKNTSKYFFCRRGDNAYYRLLGCADLVDTFKYYYLKETINQRQGSKDDVLLKTLELDAKEFLNRYARDKGGGLKEVYMSENLQQFGMDEGMKEDGFCPVYIDTKQDTHGVPVIDEIKMMDVLYLKYATTDVPWLYIKFSTSTISYSYLQLLVREHKAASNISKYIKNDALRAKVFMTKMNIPQKIIEQMQNSKFNDFFGFVEFDQLCKIELIEEIAREFTALKKLCLDPDKHDDVQIRFRLLGHHHAWGLYFPTLRCICVDVRHPGSLCHEYMHMLDFQNGELSSGYSFQQVLTCYTKALKTAANEMPEDSLTKKKLFGSSKYNLEYYLTPTEVFARCGEMYLKWHLKIENSLLSDVTGFAYPDDKQLYEEIVSYYSDFFARIRNEEEEEVRQLPALVASV